MDLLHYDEKPPTRTGYFWWSVFLLLLIGACFASWIGCFYVVSHPEDPRCYRLLKKLKRLDAPKRFTIGHGNEKDILEVPHGDFLTASKLIERYGKVGPEELAQENARLLRGYITNFHDSKKRMVNVGGKATAQQDVVYVVGKFDVVTSYLLGPTDFVPSGVVAVAQAVEAPQLLLEAVLPTDHQTAPGLKAALSTGGNLLLERSLDLFAVVHVERVPDGHIQFTTVPLPYGQWQTRLGDETFSLKSPEELEKANASDAINLPVGLPVVRGERLQKGLAAYQEYRRKILADGVEEETWKPDLIRFDPGETDNAVTPKVVGPAVRPNVLAPPESADTPISDAPAGTAPSQPGVPNRATPAPASTLANSPGPPQPPRRVVTMAEAVQYANSTARIPPCVLGGDFMVSGLDGRRAQLRAQLGPNSTITRPPIVLVDYPTGVKMPNAGAAIRRTGTHGFVVKSVQRAPNGQITIQADEETP